jgi:hypothetical protein
MIIVLIGIAAVVSIPIAAAFVVSIASHREEAAWSLGGPPRGLIDAIARRIVGFHNDSIIWPVSKARSLAEFEERMRMPKADRKSRIRTPTHVGR